jgi:hypothetical protein
MDVHVERKIRFCHSLAFQSMFELKKEKNKTVMMKNIKANTASWITWWLQGRVARSLQWPGYCLDGRKICIAFSAGTETFCSSYRVRTSNPSSEGQALKTKSLTAVRYNFHFQAGLLARSRCSGAQLVKEHVWSNEFNSRWGHEDSSLTSSFWPRYGLGVILAPNRYD